MTVIPTHTALLRGEAEGIRKSAPVGAGLTLRSFLIAVGLLVAIMPVAFDIEVLWMTRINFAAGAPPVAPVVLLFLLTTATGIPLLRRIGLTRRELLTIYAILSAGTTLGSHSVLFYMIPKTAAYYQFTQSNLLWDTKLAPYIPTWWTPAAPAAISELFTGRAIVPWELWYRPLALWCLFLLSLWTATVSLLVLVQRQWVNNEKLSFPIAEVPLQIVPLTGHGRADAPARPPRVSAFWAAFLVVFAVTFLCRLSTRVATLPHMTLDDIIAWQYRPVGPLAGVGELTLTLSPWLIGLLYLISREVLFSVWFFWLARLVLNVVLLSFGFTPGENPETGWLPYGYQAVGAGMAIGLWCAWLARRHLLRAARTAFMGARHREAGDEGLLYRGAVIALVASLTFMLAFCHASGCRWTFALALVTLLVGFYLLLARVRAEVGVAFLVIPVDIANLIAAPTGFGVLRTNEIITAVTMRWAAYSWISNDVTLAVSTGSVLDSMKIADSAGINKARLVAAIGIAFTVALGVGAAVVLTGLYHHGFLYTAAGTAGVWPGWPIRRDGDDILTTIMNPPTAQGARSFAALAVGAAGVLLLGQLRLRFPWWPFHPVGFFVGSCYGATPYLLTFLIVWTLKALAVRYGGLRLYRKTVPIAIGMIVGDMLNSFVWNLIAMATRGSF